MAFKYVARHARDLELLTRVLGLPKLPPWDRQFVANVLAWVSGCSKRYMTPKQRDKIADVARDAGAFESDRVATGLRPNWMEDRSLLPKRPPLIHGTS